MPNNLDATKNIINAFNNVIKIYGETSFLLRNFSAELAARGFESVMPGNGIGTETSKSIEYPKEWPIRYAALFFQHKKEQDNGRWLCVTVNFFHPESGDVLPRLILGVLENKNDKRRTAYEYGWLKRVYFNEGEEFTYTNEEKIKINTQDHMNMDLMDRKVINFCPNQKEKPVPLQGSFFATPLLSVNNAEEVKGLTTKIVGYWGTKYGPVK